MHRFIFIDHACVLNKQGLYLFLQAGPKSGEKGMKTIRLMLWVSIIPAFFLGSCGPKDFNKRAYNFSQHEDLMPFAHIKTPLETFSHKERSKEYEKNSDANFPYLINAAPYYCDPSRYPPQIVLSAKACQPYVKAIYENYSKNHGG
jgi:hypothetical protein